jgi:hypothetical protein
VVAEPGVDVPFLAALEALRRAGADRSDPVAFRRLDALARRIEGQPEGVRRLLEASLRRGLAALEARLGTSGAEAPSGQAGAPVMGRTASRVDRVPPCAPLVRLNRELREAAGAEATDSPATRADPMGARSAESPRERPSVDGDAPWPMLRSVRRFHAVWTLLQAADRVQRAMARGPANAGPLNSERLLLRSLGMMRDLSTDYLRRFLSQADALLWLDQIARDALPAPEAPPRRPRSRKDAGEPQDAHKGRQSGRRKVGADRKAAGEPAARKPRGTHGPSAG